LKSEERSNILHDKSQQLDKLNSQLRSQVAKLESDLTASQQAAKNAEEMVRQLRAHVESGKDFNN
jgi:ABC-type transporter Mla subunit MlaD